MLPHIENLLTRPRASFETTGSFFLGFSSKYKHSRLCIFKLFSVSTEWSSSSQWNLLLDNPKHVWRQPSLDLTRDSHTQQIEQLSKKTWLGFSLLYLRQNIKPYSCFDRSSLILDRSSQAELHSKFCSNSIPTLHKTHILWASLNKSKTCFDHGLPTIQIRVLIH